MPGTPGTLSVESPASAWISTTFSGPSPKRSTTSSGPILPVLHGVDHEHAGADQLHQVLVGGNDGDVAAGLDRLLRVGGDQIVGLVALLLDAGHVEGTRRVADDGELRHEVFRCGRAVGLVVGVDVVAERLAGIVEDHRQVGRLVLVARILEQLPQHLAEAVNRAGRQPVGGAREGRQRMVGAEDVARPVDKEDVVAFLHGRRATEFESGFPAFMERTIERDEEKCVRFSGRIPP